MIGNNINELIAMAESQSDERLAQELNPQTETGMLGPTWLPASELSFREKMRSGAQAQQQQNNLPIIDQLAQSAMMPQGMPPQQQMMPQGMPQQMPPQQMPPQQMMPQEPMPQGMPPQMMAEGGLIEKATKGFGFGLGVSDDGTAKWWNPAAGLPHVQYANLQATGEPMIGLPLGNIGNITKDVSENWAGIYEPKNQEAIDEWNELTKDPNHPFYEEKKSMSAGGLLNYANGGLPANTYYDPVNDMIIDKATGKVATFSDMINAPDASSRISRHPELYNSDGLLKSPAELRESGYYGPNEYATGEFYDQTQGSLGKPRNKHEDSRLLTREEVIERGLPIDQWESLVASENANNTVASENANNTDDNGFWSRPFLQDLGRGFMSQNITEPQLYEYANRLEANREAEAAGKEIPYATPAQDVIGVTDTKEFLHDRYIGDDDKFNYGTALLDAATVIPVGGAAFAGARGLAHLGKAGLGAYRSGKLGRSARAILERLKTGAQATVTRPGKVVTSKSGKEYSVHSPQGKAILSGKTPPKPVSSKNVPREVSGPRSAVTGGGLIAANTLLDDGDAVDDKELTETQALEEIQVTAQKRDHLLGQDPASNKQTVAFDGDGNPIVTTPSTIETDGGSRGVTDDVMQAEQQRLDELKDQIFKGNMDRKWMAIAAGAFNAAQKGSPTLMQGLADLGGGVTQELQKMDKEDQDRAMALYEIYIQEATLKESKRKTDLTYSSDMAAVISKMTQAGIDNKMEQLKYLLESGTDYADIAKSVTQGMIGEDYQFTADILHSKIGNPSAQIGYNQHLSKLINKEAEIISKIEEEIGEDYDPKNSEHKERATALYDEFLNDNPGLREIRSDYWSGANQSDWVTGTLIL